MSPIFYTMFGWGMENGGEKSGEKRVFFCCFVERGKGGGFWWGSDVLSLGSPKKKIPQIGQKKGRKRGVGVK